MVLLGETQSAVTKIQDTNAEEVGLISNTPPRAKAWMKQTSVTAEELEQVFHTSEDQTEVIAAHIPGRNKKEQTYNAYVLTGVAQLLSTGSPTFQDKTARALCESSGCYDYANHAKYLKNRGNEFTGTKDKGWTLTAPGLKRGAEIIKELNKSE
jgi:hypothetical protein